MLKILKLVTLAALIVICFPVAAQDDRAQREADEARQQQAFIDGMTEMVDVLNVGSFDRLVRAVDQDDMLERIFGLRLIDQKIKRDFREDMQEPGRFESLLESYYQAEAKDGIRATLLTVESRGDRGRAVVRFDMAFFQVNYIEYDLRLDDKDRLVILDWTDYLWGHTYSDRMGLMMIQAQPNKNAARKLIDFPSVREQQVFQLMEVLKASRDYDFDRYFQIVDGLGPELRRQRVVMKVGLDATRLARKRRQQRKVLVAIHEHFPEDPLYAMALLDYYFPDGQYENAYDALLRLRDKLRIDDAVMNARLSSATLVMGQLENATEFATMAVSQEPELELGWWAVLRARVAGEQFADAVTALEKLASDFGHSLGPDELGKDPSMAAFVRSEEYRLWHEGKSS